MNREIFERFEDIVITIALIIGIALIIMHWWK
jgi:hypothetical protein